MEIRILNVRQVSERLGLSRATITRAEARGEFPARRKMTPGRYGWLESDIAAWLEGSIAADASNRG
ncbi:MAG: AlpA family phage regulatory protein [Deltaproteobacteria bacterium]|nr:AlpA family phage regulatory protein [Deltaproteobacteria bacterium]